MANPISLDEYRQLLAAGQKYVTDAQANDPAWQAWKQAYDSTSWDSEKPASPSKDYWSEYMGTLSPSQQAGFNEYMMAPTWQSKVGDVLKVAIPAAVGAVGIGGATGLLGGAGDAAAAGASYGGGSMAEQAAINAALADGAGTGGAGSLLGGAASTYTSPYVALPGAAGTGSSWLSSLGPVGSALSSAGNFLGENRGLVSLLGGALAAAGSGNNSGSTASKTYAPQFGMNAGTMRQTSQAGQPSTFTPQPTSGLLNSGLARYGATGGLFQPGQYRPTLYSWGK